MTRYYGPGQKESSRQPVTYGATKVSVTAVAVHLCCYLSRVTVCHIAAEWRRVHSDVVSLPGQFVEV